MEIFISGSKCLQSTFLDFKDLKARAIFWIFREGESLHSLKRRSFKGFLDLNGNGSDQDRGEIHHE